VQLSKGNSISKVNALISKLNTIFPKFSLCNGAEALPWDGVRYYCNSDKHICTHAHTSIHTCKCTHTHASHAVCKITFACIHTHTRSTQKYKRTCEHTLAVSTCCKQYQRPYTGPNTNSKALHTRCHHTHTSILHTAFCIRAYCMQHWSEFMQMQTHKDTHAHTRAHTQY
jgi:hypothetical protein